MSRLRRNGLIVVAVMALCAGVLWFGAGLAPAARQHSGGAFALTAHDGRAVTESSWPGKLLLISFGYRYCPDVCPTNLQTGANALDLLGKDAGAVQFLFVTIDPERDSKEALAPYVALFTPRLLGLTGKPEKIAAIAKTFRVYYRKVPGATPDSYSMDHSAFTVLANDRGGVVKLFNHDTTAEQMAEGIRLALRPKVL